MNNVKIRYANMSDIPVISGYDKHIAKAELENAVKLKRVYVALVNGNFAGWLRYSLFWDNTPFLNMLYVLEEYRKTGIGRRITEFWEKDMKRTGYSLVMTSTQADEYAQHFYYHMGYDAVGGFRLAGDVFEMIFSKSI